MNYVIHTARLYVPMLLLAPALIAPMLIAPGISWAQAAPQGAQPPAETDKALRARVEKQSAAGKDVFVYYKHEDTPEGALYAEELLKGS